MNDSLKDLPLVEPPVVDPPDALEDELDDEQPTVRASSMTAAAPAVGTAKDRFILAPSRETRSAAGPGPHRGRTVGACGARPADVPLTGGSAVQLLAISWKHIGSIVQQPCHRCQDSCFAFFFRVKLGLLGSMYRFGFRS